MDTFWAVVSATGRMKRINTHRLKVMLLRIGIGCWSCRNDSYLVNPNFFLPAFEWRFLWHFKQSKTHLSNSNFKIGQDILYPAPILNFLSRKWWNSIREFWGVTPQSKHFPPLYAKASSLFFGVSLFFDFLIFLNYYWF